tara:strand:+ start:287 stop:517 length:231 start_codon:yes stop_codon:yes gene_type:complete
VREGEYFGEIALLDESIPGVPPNRRLATVRALQFSELQSVGKEHVKRVCEEFPEVRTIVARWGCYIPWLGGLLDGG